MDIPENKYSIQPSDIISGALYLKLVEDYKQYDNNRKKYINSLLNEIDNLKYLIELKDWDVQMLQTVDEDDKDIGSQTISHLQYKLYRRRILVKKLREQIKTLKKQNRELMDKIVKLNLIIDSPKRSTDLSHED